MPSRNNKRRIEEGEAADAKRTASGAGQAPVDVNVGNDDAAATCEASTSSVSSQHDLHANLPLFVTGPALVQATSGAAWCHGWRLQSSTREGDGNATLPPPLRKHRRLDLFAVPAGAVARLEAAPLGPGDVPLTARSCRVQVTVPNGQAGAVSRALPQSGEAGAGAAGTAATGATTLPPPPPAPWRAAAASIAAGALASVAAGGGPPSVVVVGPKNAGKSSFARLLTNELLSAFSAAAAAATNDSKNASASASASASFPSVVAWCDVDCGQPELTPPGLVSLSHVSRPLLAGGGISGDPGTTTGRRSSGGNGDSGDSGDSSALRPARAHFLGALSPASDPERACAAAASLLGWHWQHGGGVETGQGGGGGGGSSKGKKKKKEETKTCWPPLVVNSAGWVRGAGLDLLAAALAAARATHVVRLSTGNAERDAPAVFELFEGGQLPSFLEVVELPALSSSSSGSVGVGEDFGGAEHEAAAAAAAAPPSLFQGIFPTPAAATSRYSAADSRTASWFAFARSCVESAAADRAATAEEEEGEKREEERGEEEEEEEEEAAPPSSASSHDLVPAALAAARPMVLPLSSVRLEFLGEKPSGGLANALRALNGSVVALATAAEAGKGVGEEEEQEGGEGGEGGGGRRSAAAPAPPSPTASLALVRGVDGRKGLLHLLCPLRSSEAAAAGVVALQVGHCSLELPPALLAGGAVSSSSSSGVFSARRNSNSQKKITNLPVAVSSSPYLAPWCLAAGGTGARAAKARNDLARGGGGGGRS